MQEYAAQMQGVKISRLSGKDLPVESLGLT